MLVETKAAQMEAKLLHNTDNSTVYWLQSPKKCQPQDITTSIKFDPNGKLKCTGGLYKGAVGEGIIIIEYTSKGF